MHAFLKSSRKSQRQRQVGKEIQARLMPLLRERHCVSETGEAIPLTITHVEVSSDLRKAWICVVALGMPMPEGSITLLNRDKSYFHKLLSQNWVLKFLPTLYFRHDEVFEKASRLNHLMRQVCEI